jgi:hypothetical protein
MAATRQRYAGKVTQVGNSKRIRLDAAFFRAHPEFGGEIQATVLAEGQVLLSAKAKRRTRGKPGRGGRSRRGVVLRVSRAADAGAP